jgi:hypothetical protein
LNYCVVALLDALGVSTAHKNVDPQVLIEQWNIVDDKLEMYLKMIKDKLGEHNYNNRVVKQGPYDNFQIVVPVDIRQSGPVDMSPRNSAWWTIHHIGELLIPLFRHSLFNGIFLRGCISAGPYYQTSKGRIFGNAASEAAIFREKSNWLGVIAAPSAQIVLNTAELMDNNISNESFETFVRYDVPMNSNKYKAKWTIK